MSRQNKIVICGFVVGIIIFIVVNIIHPEVFNMLYLLMLIIYFLRFLNNRREENRLRKNFNKH